MEKMTLLISMLCDFADFLPSYRGNDSLVNLDDSDDENLERVRDFLFKGFPLDDPRGTCFGAACTALYYGDFESAASLCKEACGEEEPVLLPFE